MERMDYQVGNDTRAFSRIRRPLTVSLRSRFAGFMMDIYPGSLVELSNRIMGNVANTRGNNSLAIRKKQLCVTSDCRCTTRE